MNAYANRVPEILELLQTKLKPNRYQHSLNVAEAARTLAELNGEDPDLAYVCGLLHDIEKNAPPEEQKKYMMQLGCTYPEAVLNNPKLWHAPAGAAYCRDELGILDEPVLSAIKYHTIGKANMSVLDKIIYTADLISKERNYPDVETVREAAYRNLDEGAFLGAQFTLQTLLQHKEPLNHDTLAMYNELAVALKQQRQKEQSE